MRLKGIFGFFIVLIALSQPTDAQNVCSVPVLSRLQRHRIVNGETIASIANTYGLNPETLIRLNPTILKNNTAPVGKDILIPPINGFRVEAPPGASWKDLEAAYGIRADILFELNGCTREPRIVFIPGNARTNALGKIDDRALPSFPLPFKAKIGLGYGWQENKTEQKRLFHSGIDLLADVGTPVLAAEDGLVIYVGQEEAYGNLIVINHRGNLQTRYAHLKTVSVRIDERVRAGETIGTVGTSGQPDIIPPHLHFEVRFRSPVGWLARDPALHLQPR